MGWSHRYVLWQRFKLESKSVQLVFYWGLLLVSVSFSIQFKEFHHPTHIATFIAYTLQMMLLRAASSPYFNMSLLTSDFYGLLFGASPCQIYIFTY